MTAREAKGTELAASGRITQQGSVYFVPSQSGNGKYRVDLSGPSPTCNCVDYETRADICKHIFGVLHLLRSQHEDRKEIAVAVRPPRPTYKQDWPAYNAAQVNEKRRFCALLQDLCATVEEPPQTFGRPRHSLADVLFCIGLKTYVGFSGRRLMSDVLDAHEKGHLGKAPHYSSIFRTLEEASTKDTLLSLITRSALPLKSVETEFAVDSTGLRVSGYVRWFNTRYGHEQDNQDWIKLHFMTGTRTNIVTSVEITDRYAHDSPYFAPLVEKTAQQFTIDNVSADKAYSSRDNHTAAGKVGATPYIQYRKNATGTACGSPLWHRMFHLYNLNREEFLGHYHKRSNAESTVQMIKSKFGERITCKTEAGKVNEALAKVLCHNVCVVIQSMYELGIEPTFWKEDAGRSVNLRAV